MFDCLHRFAQLFVEKQNNENTYIFETLQEISKRQLDMNDEGHSLN